MYSVSLSQKRGEGDPLVLYSNRVLPLCPCHDYYFKVFTRDKDGLFVYPLSVVDSISEGKQEVVNALSGALLSPLSEKANRRLVVKIQPEAQVLVSHEMQTGGQL